MPDSYRNIIIADDDVDDIELFESALIRTGKKFRLHKVFNGVELMKLLETVQDPDIIVLDINMPKMSGKECLIKIRANVETAAIPVLMMSTSDSQHDIDFCMGHGANNYIPKPDNFKRLKEIAKMICDNTWHLSNY